MTLWQNCPLKLYFYIITLSGIGMCNKSYVTTLLWELQFIEFRENREISQFLRFFRYFWKCAQCATF